MQFIYDGAVVRLSVSYGNDGSIKFASKKASSTYIYFNRASCSFYRAMMHPDGTSRRAQSFAQMIRRFALSPRPVAHAHVRRDVRTNVNIRSDIRKTGPRDGAKRRRRVRARDPVVLRFTPAAPF